MNSANELLARGQQAHQTGDFRQAEAAYRQALERDPSRVEGWLLLAMLCQTVGRLPEATAHFQQALKLRPDAQVYNSLGICHARQQQRDAALACFQKAVELKPDFAHAHNNVGNVLKELGRLDEALGCYQQAVRLKPDFAEAHNNLGNLLRELGRFEAAEASCRDAIRLRPDFADAHNNLGAALVEQGRSEEAEACYRRALELKPYFAEAHNNLGNLLRDQERIEEAIFSLREAVRLQPAFAEAHGGLGMALLRRGSFDEAAAACAEAASLSPARAEAHLSLGFVRSEQGLHDDAIALYERAISVNPDYAEARKNRSLVWLLQGKFEQAWPEYEYRWNTPELPERPFKQPLWDGSPLAGRSILLHAEQGLGDTIQFIRYAPLVRERGGKVIVACQRPLIPLLSTCRDIDQLVAQGDPLPDFDVHAPLLSLPRIFGTTLQTIPAETPYLAADERLVEQWRQELAATRSFKVGIAWQGSKKYRWDHKRSIPLAQFEPLARIPGVQLYSLQKGYGSEQLSEVAGRFAVIDLAPRLDEHEGAFADTAAVIKNLDLIICSDTAIPHLAGALNAPVWTALSRVPDWRWLIDREDSPWYPSMRLFRQPRHGDWESVFRRMAAELEKLVGASAGARPITVEIAPGELLDKLTILEIKSERIADAAKLANVTLELDSLTTARKLAIPESAELDELVRRLKAVNEALWDIEDEIRRCERDQDFGPRFIELARSVYRQNDRRAAVKRQINELLGSKLIEEKDYAPYESAAESKTENKEE